MYSTFFNSLYMSNIDILSVIVAIIVGIVIPFVVVLFQSRSHYEQLFRDCTNALHSKECNEQISAAILLRSFYKCRWYYWFRSPYAKEVTNVVVALLRSPIPLILQKTLADSLSYAQHLDGQDLQGINMQNVSIKPESAIKYETTQRIRYKKKRLSLRSSDLFHAVILSSNINYLDARGAVFNYALLSGTCFHNCILEGAMFECANMTNVKFDADCKLEGASFSSAIGLNTVVIKTADHKQETLLNHLDSNGVFHNDIPNEKYTYAPTKLKIFVSKLGAMDSQQFLHYQKILSLINKFESISIETINREDYATSSQLKDILTHMDGCDGCVIFAFEYLHVNKGRIHENIVSSDSVAIDDKWFASPWLHIEAAIANGKGIPCLIIYDEDLCRDGMFEPNVVSADDSLISIPYSDLLSKNEFIPWMQRVCEHHDCPEQSTCL